MLEKPGRKRVLWGVLLFLAVSLGVSAVWGWVWVKNNQKTLIFIGRGHLRNVRMLVWDPSRQVSFQVGGLRIEGSLYANRGSAKGPALVLLHGSSRPARKEALIQVLAKKFYDRGYAVLTFDFQGYGESEDPGDHHQAGAFDFVRDTQKALDFLLTQPGIDPERLYLFGHSLGAGVALALQSEDTRVKKMVLIGPPRRLKAQFLNAERSDQERWLKEWQQDMEAVEAIESSNANWTVTGGLTWRNMSPNFKRTATFRFLLSNRDGRIRRTRPFWKRWWRRFRLPSSTGISPGRTIT